MGIDEFSGLLRRPDQVSHDGTTDHVRNREQPEARPSIHAQKDDREPHPDTPCPTAGEKQTPAGRPGGCSNRKAHVWQGIARSVSAFALAEHRLGSAVEGQFAATHTQLSSLVLENLGNIELKVDVELPARLDEILDFLRVINIFKRGLLFNYNS